MTFRTAIQLQIKALQEIYDNAEALRDVVGDQQDKAAFNYTRRNLPEVWHVLQQLDNRMNEGLASYELKGDYSIHATDDHV